MRYETIGTWIVVSMLVGAMAITASIKEENGNPYEDKMVLIKGEPEPVITNDPDTWAVCGVEYVYNCTTTHDPKYTNVWNFTTNASWLTEEWSNQTNFLMNGTPTEIGWYHVLLEVESDKGCDFREWNITVTLCGPAPTITTSPLEGVKEDSVYYYDVNATEVVEWSCESNASFVTCDITTGILSGVPTNEHSELNFFVNVTCTNANGTAYSNFTLDVWNNPPTITTTPGANAYVGSLYVYNAVHSDLGVGSPPGNFTLLLTNCTSPCTFDFNGLVSVTPIEVGLFYANITADDQRGVDNSTITQNWTLTVVPALIEPPIPPIGSVIDASFTYSIMRDTVSFTDTSRGAITEWIWSFGDGIGSSAQSPSHKYSKAGTYTVTLTVFDALNHQSSVTADIIIEYENGDWVIDLGNGTQIPVSCGLGFIIGLALAISYRFDLPLVNKRIRLFVGVLLMIICAYYALMNS